MITYTVKEINVPEDYTAIVEGTNITNRYTPETTSFTVVKRWEDADNQDGIRPERVTVALVANGKEIEQVTLTVENNWTHQWTNLPKYNNGVEIKYEAKEVGAYKGYITQAVHDSRTRMTIITNTHTPEVTSFRITKKWTDADDADKIRPQSIKVQLFANGKEQGTIVEVDASTNWTHVFTDLPKYATGKEIKYEVKEIDVPKGYDATYTSENSTHMVITNSHTPTPKKEKDTLPKTGEDFPFGTTLIGALILAGVAGYVIYTKKRQK
ncbi:Cna B-type domain-containing protein [Aerococcaceae bacterium NML210727]|nr:Cna B-type domain-containing protein [Aerococcaceae bacterium NML210727]